MRRQTTPGLLVCLCLSITVTYLNPVNSSAQDCANYCDYMHWACIKTVGRTYGIAVENSYAYLADNYVGLKVVDITNPEDPLEVGALPDSATSGRHLVVDSTYAYIADYGYGVRVVDISDPTDPNLIKSVPIPGNAWGVALYEQHLYVAARTAGLYVLDVERPKQAKVVGHIGLQGRARRVVVEDSIAYVADESGMFKVVDVTDPTAPDSIGSVDTQRVFSLVKAGDYVYVGGEYNLYVIDVSDPSSPLQIYQTYAGGWCHDIAINDSLLYVADHYHGVEIFDISSPTTPTYYGAIRVGLGYWEGLDFGGGYCFVAMTYGIVTIDLGNSEMLRPLAGMYPSGDLQAVHPFGDHYAFGATWHGICPVFEISDPLSPVVIGSVDLPGITEDAAVTSIDAAPEKFAGMGLSRDIGLVGGDLGVYVFDLSNPTAPDTVAFLDLRGSSQQEPGGTNAIAVDSNYAYVTSTFYVDIPEPLTYHYCDVIDLSTPESPYILSRNSWFGRSIDIYGDYAYLAGDGIKVLDISDPASPQLVNTITSPDEATTIVVEGAYGCAGYEVGGGGPDIFYLQVLDASDPESLQALGSVTLPATILDIEIVEGYAYVSTAWAGFYLCDITDPDEPWLVGAVHTPGITRQAAIHDAYVLIADDSGGLQIAPLDCSALAGVVTYKGQSVPGLSHQGPVSAYPNPFRQSTTLAFDLAQKGHVRFSVYDVTGARVVELVDDTLPAGLHTATFEGSNLAPGVYFASVEIGGKKLTNKKVVLVK